mmetsp:Transcript_18920/g.40949  ORF Transcript_18920/g.40949 Transcript_18920/m.40949 type:complete len:274 (+) Transcript_18920:1551-2372(+)
MNRLTPLNQRHNRPSQRRKSRRRKSNPPAARRRHLQRDIPCKLPWWKIYNRCPLKSRSHYPRQSISYQSICCLVPCKSFANLTLSMMMMMKLTLTLINSTLGRNGSCKVLSLRTSKRKRRRNSPRSRPRQFMQLQPQWLPHPHLLRQKRRANHLPVRVFPEGNHSLPLEMMMTAMTTRMKKKRRRTSRLISPQIGLPIRLPKMLPLRRRKPLMVIPTRMTTKTIYGELHARRLKHPRFAMLTVPSARKKCVLRLKLLLRSAWPQPKSLASKLV